MRLHRRGVVLVFGDINIDILFYVDSLPSDDVSIVAKSMKVMHGGVGGNIAVALSRLGVKVELVGAVGTDTFGDEAIKALAQEGVDTRFIERISKEPTGVMTILVFPNGSRTIIGYRGANILANPRTALKSMNTRIAHVHISGYMALSKDGEANITTLAKRGKEVGTMVSIDLEGIATEKPELVHRLKGYVDYVFLNKDEMTYLIGVSSIEEGIKRIYEILKPSAVFLKLGSQGSAIITNDKVLRIPPFRVEVVDTTGAGDAFNAGVIYGLMLNLKPEEAALLGNAMGAYSCMGYGARHLPRDINELLNKFPTLNKILKTR